MVQPPTATIRHIKEDAKETVRNAFKGVNALTALNQVNKLVDSARARADENDLQAALKSYYQAASILEYVFNHPEYLQESPKGQHGALYKQTSNTIKNYTEVVKPRIAKLEARYTDLQQASDSQPSPTDEGPNQKPGGSIQDRLRALQSHGVDISGANKRSSLQSTTSASSQGRSSPAFSDAPNTPSSAITVSTSNGHRHRPSASVAQSHTFTPSLTAIPAAAEFTVRPPSSGPSSSQEQSAQALQGYTIESNGMIPPMVPTKRSPLPRPPSLPPSSPQPSTLPSINTSPSTRPSSYSSSSRPASLPPTPKLPTQWTGGSSSNPTHNSSSSISYQPTGGSFGSVMTPSISHFNTAFPSIDEMETDPAFELSSNGPTGLSTLEEIERLSITASPRPSSTDTSTLATLNGLPSVNHLPSVPIFPSVPNGRVTGRRDSLPPPPAMPPSKDIWRDVPIAPDFSVNGTNGTNGEAPNGRRSSTSQGVPSHPTGSSTSSSRPTSHPPRSDPAPVNKRISKQPDPPPTIPRTNVIRPMDLAKYMPSYKILLLDVRERDKFDAERINGDAIVCLDPTVIARKTTTQSADLESALVISPSDESTVFNNRHKFDLVVIYDQNSESVNAPANANRAYTYEPAPGMTVLAKLIDMIADHEFAKPLKRFPMLLQGGMDGWVKAMGKDPQWVTGSSVSRSTPQPNGVNGYEGSTVRLVGQSNGVNGVGQVNGYGYDGTILVPTKPRQDGAAEKSNHRREGAGTDQASHVGEGAENPPPAPRPEPLHQLKRKSTLFRTSSSGNISAYNRHDPNGPMYGGTQPITYPTRVTSPPLDTPTPQPISSFSGASPYLHNPISPPPAALSPSIPRPQASLPSVASPISRRRADYPEQAQHSYSGSPNTSSIRTPINYPILSAQNIVQPPPPAASSTLERNDNRPRPSHAPSFSTTSVSVTESMNKNMSMNGPVIIDGKPLIPSATIKSYYPVMYWTHEQVGLSGLKNLGNTCYMNSIVQCLSATVPFARFFIDGRWKSAVNYHNPLGTQGTVAQAFATLVHDMWQREVPVQLPYSFRKQICLFAKQFSGSDQHDSQEFLSFLLDGLHEDLNRVLKKPVLEPPSAQRELELESLPQQIAGAQEWTLYQMRDDSLVVDYFQGQFRNKLTCMTCGKTSTTYNSFMYLSLPIPAARGVSKVSLEQCLNAFVREEVLEKAEAWNCPNCKVPRKAVKQLSLSRMPPVLLIHLKRFSFKGPFTDKLETLVTFPTRGLDLTNYMPPPLHPAEAKAQPLSTSGLKANDPRAQVPPYRYDLYGVTNHYGSLSSGHYTAFIGTQGGWVYCDDSRIREADEREIVGSPAYILFYKRVPTAPPIPPR